MTSGLIKFPDLEMMTDRLSYIIASQLAYALDVKPRALLAVSGGSSPKPLYEKLSKVGLDWSRVDIVLVDERWVDPWENGSNEAFIQETLIQNKADIASLIGLKTIDISPYEALGDIEAKLAELSTEIDVAIMGMGPDAHTASWFPGAKNLDTALSLRGGQKVAAITAQKSEVTGDFLDRITLTLPFIMTAALTILMMNGVAKQEAFDRALKPDASHDEFPVRALIDQCKNLWPCWVA